MTTMSSMICGRVILAARSCPVLRVTSTTPTRGDLLASLLLVAFLSMFCAGCRLGGNIEAEKSRPVESQSKDPKVDLLSDHKESGCKIWRRRGDLTTPYLYFSNCYIGVH